MARRISRRGALGPAITSRTRLHGQLVRANCEPSERYVLSPPGASRVPHAFHVPRPSSPRYVERLGEIATRPPYAMNGVQLYSFLLGARRERLCALVDRYLNEPSGGAAHYVPIAPLVALVCAFTSAASSLDPACAAEAPFPEADVAFWIPCLSLT